METEFWKQNNYIHEKVDVTFNNNYQKYRTSPNLGSQFLKNYAQFLLLWRSKNRKEWTRPERKLKNFQNWKTRQTSCVNIPHLVKTWSMIYAIFSRRLLPTSLTIIRPSLRTPTEKGCFNSTLLLPPFPIVPINVKLESSSSKTWILLLP